MSSVLSLETTANVSKAPPQASSFARCFGGPIWLHLENGPTLAQAVCPLQRMKQAENFKDLPDLTQILEPNTQP